MPLSLNQINAITQKKFLPKLYDNIFDSNVLLSEMKKGDGYRKIDGGERIVVPLEYAQLTAAGSYSGAELLQTTDNETFTGAEYTWKQYYANISITGIDKLKNAGEAQVIDFVKSKVKNAERTLAQKLGDGLYSSGSDADDLVGLRVAASSSNTVGGISQTDYSWWRMANLDTSSTTVTLALLKDAIEDATVDSEKPDLITTTRTLHNSIWGLMQPQQRFMDTKKASAGFENILVNGVPVVADSKCPANHLFVLNTKHIFLSVHRECDMKFLPFVRPINQDVESAKVLWAGALCYSNLRLLGAFTALTA
jgi:hypothetical protein